ncbi:nmrA-like family [Aspergillus sp. HF37]|nr:nmrA-like family [Aspergillus sp. HF37]
MTLKYLVTGATGGLGAQVLSYMIANLPPSEYAAASSRESNRSRFEDQGVPFRVVNYDEPHTLEAAFADVQNLLFVSTNTFDVGRRARQHRNFVDAARKMGVKHVWYTSLAFGGFGSDSKVDVQQAHLMTEDMLRESGITYTSIREGVYADAFPVFLGWYPQSETVYLPSDGPVAYTPRAELGEATARLMIRGGFEKQIVLLTAQENITFAEMVEAINEATGRDVRLELVPPEDYVRLAAGNDIGGKPEAFFRTLLSWYEGISKGDGGTTDPLMAELLGREPTGPRQFLRGVLAQERDYTWHQNYAS